MAGIYPRDERRSGEINFARVKDSADGRWNIRLVSANACHRGNHKPFSWHVAAAAAERGRRNGERAEGDDRNTERLIDDSRGGPVARDFANFTCESNAILSRGSSYIKLVKLYRTFFIVTLA